jgi:hypothetical protein
MGDTGRGTRSRGEWLLELREANPILNNVIDLLADARALRAGQRYPTATALAVLSLEETGKYLAMAANGIAKRFSHKKKQGIAAQFLIKQLGIDQVEDLLAPFGYKMQIVRKGESRISLEEALDDYQDPSVDLPDVRQSRHVHISIGLLRGSSIKPSNHVSMWMIWPWGRIRQ